MFPVGLSISPSAVATEAYFEINRLNKLNVQVVKDLQDSLDKKNERVSVSKQMLN